MTRYLCALALLACDSDTSKPPETIIETGYLACVGGGECDATCVDTDGVSACLDAPADGCVGENSCACEGDWVCGERTCRDTGGGFECLAETSGELDGGVGRDMAPPVPDMAPPVPDMAPPVPDMGPGECVPEGEPVLCARGGACAFGPACWLGESHPCPREWVAVPVGVCEGERYVGDCQHSGLEVVCTDGFACEPWPFCYQGQVFACPPGRRQVPSEWCTGAQYTPPPNAPEDPDPSLAELAADPRCNHDDNPGALPECELPLTGLVCAATECPDAHQAYYRCDGAAGWAFVEREGEACE